MAASLTFGVQHGMNKIKKDNIGISIPNHLVALQEESGRYLVLNEKGSVGYFFSG